MMYKEIAKYNKLFRAKTYSDAYMDFYRNYREIFEHFNDMAEEGVTENTDASEAAGVINEAAKAFVNESVEALKKYPYLSREFWRFFWKMVIPAESISTQKMVLRSWNPNLN